MLCVFSAIEAGSTFVEWYNYAGTETPPLNLSFQIALSINILAVSFLFTAIYYLAIGLYRRTIGKSRVGVLGETRGYMTQYTAMSSPGESEQ